MTLPNDYARCGGAGWEECDDCQRRTTVWSGIPGGGRHIEPPQIVTFQCEHYISPDDMKFLHRRDQ